MDREKILRRSRILVSLILVFLIIFMYLLFRRGSALPGLSVQSDEVREDALDKIKRQETIEGKITDCRGQILSEASEPGAGAVLVFPEIYSYLLGYNSRIYGTYGLRGRYGNYLYMQGKDKTGATIKLTLDHNLQALAYDQVRDTDASMVVLEVSTGRILALASSREDTMFNANELTAENMEEWNKTDGLFYPNGYKDPSEPGSVFKVVTASAVLEQGADQATVVDKGSQKIGGRMISNSKKTPRGEIGLQEALGYSSNIYFAQKAVDMGGEVLKHKMEDYLIGQEIPLDFTTIRSNIDLGDFQENLVAETGFGQGNTLITPLHLAMIGQSIANGGVMLKPYMVDQISLDDKILYQGSGEQLAAPLDKETAEKLKALLKNVSADYYHLPEEGICSKTGTAQLPDNMVKQYYLSFDEDYVVLMARKAKKGFGIDLKGYVMNIYEYLREKE